MRQIMDALPRIVSPNLGCPLILSADNTQNNHAYLVLAERREEMAPEWTSYRLRAEPSYSGEGKAFPLDMTALEELHDDALPECFTDVAQTRLLISTTLRSNVFRNQARFWSFRVKPQDQVDLNHLRRASATGQPCSTLFDLVLCKNGQEVSRVKHALFLRMQSLKVRFVHLTDLHVATRNDIWEKEVNRTINPSPGARPLQFINFNEKLRRFVQSANEKADKAKLDLVLATGDLVDFVHLGFGKPNPGENNWHVLHDILAGGDQGLRVPLYTTSGNHDWRLFPYPPEFNANIFGFSKAQAKKLDHLYHDSSAVIGEKISSVHSKLVQDGSPVLARTWWRSLVLPGWRWLHNLLQRSSMRIVAISARNLTGPSLTKVGTTLSAIFLGLIGHGASVDLGLLDKKIWQYLPDTKVVLLIYLVLVVALILWQLVKNWMGDRLRHSITALIAIESSVEALRDYFLHFNPYFNYAFRLEKCYFLLVDSGHDCLTARSLWDQGGKKIKRVSVSDNIVGGSPDTMAFFPPNQYFHYSQIAFLDMVLCSIQREHNQEKDGPRQCRVFVGLHTPPANLSKGERCLADRKLARAACGQLLMRRRHWLLGGFDIRYGNINHYLSEFFYLCLGYSQSEPSEFKGPGVDAVFAGHAHWCIEFRLQRPAGVPLCKPWKPEVYYGNFSQEVDSNANPANRWWGPLLLQTAACGPPSQTDIQTDKRSLNFRYVTVDTNLGVTNLRNQNAKSL